MSTIPRIIVLGAKKQQFVVLALLILTTATASQWINSPVQDHKINPLSTSPSLDANTVQNNKSASILKMLRMNNVLVLPSLLLKSLAKPLQFVSGNNQSVFLVSKEGHTVLRNSLALLLLARLLVMKLHAAPQTVSTTLDRVNQLLVSTSSCQASSPSQSFWSCCLL